MYEDCPLPPIEDSQASRYITASKADLQKGKPAMTSRPKNPRDPYDSTTPVASGAFEDAVSIYGAFDETVSIYAAPPVRDIGTAGDSLTVGNTFYYNGDIQKVKEEIAEMKLLLQEVIEELKRRKEESK
jgi:hypothetical protein